MCYLWRIEEKIILYMKRYCQTLTLVDDEALIEKYIEVHSHVWPEVLEGQREVGILQMEIFHLFMEKKVFSLMSLNTKSGINQFQTSNLEKRLI